MNLYYVRNEENSMWVSAKSLADAVSKWIAYIASETNVPEQSVDEPEGVELICVESDFLY